MNGWGEAFIAWMIAIMFVAFLRQVMMRRFRWSDTWASWFAFGLLPTVFVLYVALAIWIDWEQIDGGGAMGLLAIPLIFGPLIAASLFGILLSGIFDLKAD
jgi:apolipoprotein N-acyltransferase